MNKYLYFIKDLKVETWIKWWLVRKGSITIDYVLGELTTGTDITINNTVEKTFYKLDVKGNSTQETTTGKNYLPITLESGTTNGLIYTVKEDKQIIFSGSPINNINRLYFFTGSITLKAGDYTVWFLGKTASDLSLYATIDGAQTLLFRQSDTKNYYDISFANDVVLTEFYAFIPQTTTIINKTVGFMITNLTQDSTYEQFTYGASPNPNYPQPILSAGDNNSISEKIENADGTKSQTYTIPVQQPMRSIGTVRDEFIQVNEEWKERHNIARVVLNGSENWSLYSESADASRRFGISYPGYLKPQQALSNYFICEYNDGTNKTTNVLFFNKGGFYLGVTDNINTWDGAQTFKNWLSTHNTEVIYQLVTPTDLPCTAEQIAILENLPKSYNEQTNIYSLDVTPAYLEVQAYVKKEGEINEGD